jgi:hypothetical protein
MKKVARVLLVSSIFAAGYALGSVRPALVAPAEASEAADRVFEIRTYTTHEGRLDNLNDRFRNYTVGLFEKHGMTNVGYWVPEDSVLSRNTLIYVLSYPNREAARASWQGFRTDPDWHAARTASEADGPIVSKVESVYLNPTDYSRLR